MVWDHKLDVLLAQETKITSKKMEMHSLEKNGKLLGYSSQGDSIRMRILFKVSFFFLRIAFCIFSSLI